MIGTLNSNDCGCIRYSVSRSALAKTVLKRLRVRIPRPETELVHGDDFELLVAVMLSAQCTDERVNKVTPDLFAAYPTAEAMSKAMPEDIFPYIQSVTYPNSKSKALAVTSRMLVEEFDGEVPNNRKDLMKLRGVGRKTANVMLAVAFDEPAFAVDTHVFRVANRIGLVNDAPTPRKVEEGLHRIIPKEEWGEAHHLLILHGRYTCTARKPNCGNCPLVGSEEGPDLCDYYARFQELPDPVPGLDPEKGAYYCTTHEGYIDEPKTKVDRRGVVQKSCPRCGSMQLFESESGEPTLRVKDYRVNGKRNRKNQS